MFSFDPFAWIYSCLGYLQELWGRLDISQRIKETWLFQKIFGLYLDVSIVPEAKESTSLDAGGEDGVRDRLTQLGQLLIHVLIVQPYNRLVDLLGLSFEWLISRAWLAIFMYAVPAMVLAVTTASVWYGGRINSRKLATTYFELALKEIRDSEFRSKIAETSPPRPSNLRSNSRADSGPAMAFGSQTAEAAFQKASPRQLHYIDTLLKRSQLLNPQNRWKYQIGISMLEMGAYESGRKRLSKLAPDDSRGMLAAHAAIATSYLIEFTATENRELMPRFVHHAEAAVHWKHTPKKVLLALSSAYWETGEHARSLGVLKTATERFGGLHPIIYQRAVSMGDQELALSARQKASEELSAALQKDPTDFRLRVALVQILDTKGQGLAASEKILRDGIDLEPNPLLMRALSEVYRIAFVRQILESNESMADLNLLDLALQTDPTNPLVVDQIQSLITSRPNAQEDFAQTLNKVLVSGTATIGTHAILAEMHLNSQNFSAAVSHLEQVYAAAPSAARYTNQLVLIYDSRGQTDDAIRFGVKALSILDDGGHLKERYVDDLLHTMGTIFLKVGQNKDAIAALENALEAKPDRLDTRTALLKYYRGIGDERSASIHEAYTSGLEKSAIQSSSPKSETAGSNGGSSRASDTDRIETRE